MPSPEVIKAVTEYENYIKRKGVDEKLLEAYSLLSGTAIEDDRSFGLRISARAKLLVADFVKKQTEGGDLWWLEKWTFAHKTEANILNVFYDILLAEARAQIFDSYMLYIERKREPKERFYRPKRKQFLKHGITQAYQGLLDDKYDILCISQPPGTGKAQPLYSKVLTPHGFVRMGDIKVGDTVISGEGNPAKVLGVYPQGVKDVYEFTLETGHAFRCSTEHLCYVRWWQCGRAYEKVKEASEILWNHGKYFLPVLKNGNKYFLRITKVKHIGEEECQCIYIDDPSHLYVTDDYIITHNTTTLKFFNSAVIGWFPKDYNLFYSHSSDITRMYYDGVYQMVTDGQEYTWHDIFPDLKVTSTNAKMQQFNVSSYKPFPSLQTASVGSENAGKVRASKFLLVDDLIGKLEEALNKNTLEKLWGAYTVDARQRRTVDRTEKPCKEVVQATRWSPLDPIGRIIQSYQGNDRVKVISIPDIDPVTGESNFDYEFGGFTKEFFADQALLMDEISYKCLYKQEPIEREGLLYHEDELRRYVTLPEKEPDAILGVCDTKAKGTDYMVLPVMLQYGEDFYMADCICDNSTDFGLQKERLANIICDNAMQQCEFESNAGGDRLAHEVNELVEQKGGRCNITTKATETNKETRIIVNSDWVKKHVLFRDKENYTAQSDYGKFMSFLLSYSIAGKNAWDDVPDCLANFALYITRKTRVRTAVVLQSPL